MCVYSRGFTVDGGTSLHTAALAHPGAVSSLHGPEAAAGRDVVPTDLSLPPAWQGRSVAGPKLRLVEMLAYAERGCQYDPNSVSILFM